ncbi:long-chain fatty acid transport protein 2-like isoform X1 [Paramormyrops kingsleyae]|uniref:long-chain fatty acid transport protein 2-like isoform X1 n=1 Tax=Paramormyrops kingsleyae TaxID=1676925 RepID=UPI003B978FF8
MVFSMLTLYAALAGLAVLPFLLCSWFPYLLHDLRFFLATVHVGVFISKCKRKKPCYTVVDCFLDKVKKNPNKPFIVFGDEIYSYKDADKVSNKIARALLTHARLKDGDTVAVFLGNEPLYVWIYLALAKLGCVVALLNCNIRSKSLLHCFSCSGARVLIAAADLKSAVEEVLPGLKESNASVFILGEECDTQGIETLSDKISQASDEAISPTCRSNITLESPSVYIYTSGTTGLPKAAMLSHERVWLMSFLQKLNGVTSGDVMYVYLPLYHSSGFLMGLCGAIERGVTIVLKRKFSASQFWDDCRKYNVTVMQYIGEIMRYLCNQPKKDNDRDHKVRLAIGNGIRTDTWSKFLRRYGDVRICECYGATESNIAFLNYIGKLGACGRECFLFKMFCRNALIKYDTEKEEPVRDSRGFCVQVPKGETGLLVAKITKITPFAGYARNPQQTQKKRLRDVFQKGDLYFNTGDLMKIDHEGFVYFQDRIGDTFRWKGENVATTEVAEILIMVNCIKEANVFGVKVPGHEGRVGMAALLLEDGQNFDGARTYEVVQSYLPSYARPRFLRIQSYLPVTGTFKQMKVKLAEEGFDPGVIQDPLYFLDDSKKSYIPLAQEVYESIRDGTVKL